MSQTPNDPAGTTHQFQNFQNQGRAAEKSSGLNVGLIVGVVAVVALIAILMGAFMMIK